MSNLVDVNVKAKCEDQKCASDMSFEDALSELEKITNLLERGDLELDEAVKKCERACVLQTHCQKKLDDAHMQIKKLLQKNGEVSDVEDCDLGKLYCKE
jgi:exodeoxyribonuclease VII small subunit